MIIILNKKITPDQFEQAREEYPDYIKTVIDIEKDILAVGGQFHSDCEEVLIKTGSKMENLYGGGYRISTDEVEYMAMSNYKPALGQTTYEIMNKDVRTKLEELTRKYLSVN